MNPSILLTTVLLSALIVNSGCARQKEKPRPKPPAPVLVAKAQLADIPLKLVAAGTVEATESITIRPLISGELSAVFFNEGQDVVRGQKLFMIDPRALQASVKKAEATLSRNRIIMENAIRDYRRYDQLVKEGIVTQEQAEGYRTKAESASADVEADRATLENAKVQLSYTTITAPVSGRIGNLAVSRGNIVEANKTALVTLNTMTPVNVTFTIPEKYLADVRKRMSAGKMTVEIELHGGIKEKGTISFIDNMVDPATGTFRLKGVFDNKKQLLLPGQFVQVAVTLAERKGAVAVPSQALQTGQKGTFVFVIRQDNTAEMRNVKAGPTNMGLTAIDSGLAAGEQVVIDGQLRVTPDAKVEIKTP